MSNVVIGVRTRGPATSKAETLHFNSPKLKVIPHPKHQDHEKGSDSKILHLAAEHFYDKVDEMRTELSVMSLQHPRKGERVWLKL
jgi:hypothetical protein